MHGDGVVVWLTGLPASGKSTLARELQRGLRDEGLATVVLDGDAVRQAVHPAPGYDAAGRDEQYATLADLAALLARQGLVVVVAATAHRRRWRERARAAAPRFIEVWVDTPAEECAQRDPKRLYERAGRGQIVEMPGVDVEYEPPAAADVVAEGGRDERAVATVTRLVRAR